MKLTNELKERFKALYWGQKVGRSKGSYMKLAINKSNFLNIDYLELRPLYSITEEEAKECALSGMSPKEREASIKLFDFMCVDHAECISDIFTNKEPIEGGYVKYIIANIDYLRSKGFLLDAFGIKADKWVEWGVVKLKS